MRGTRRGKRRGKNGKIRERTMEQGGNSAEEILWSLLGEREVNDVSTNAYMYIKSVESCKSFGAGYCCHIKSATDIDITFEHGGKVL